jgi:hypothetical protein
MAKIPSFIESLSEKYGLLSAQTKHRLKLLSTFGLVNSNPEKLLEIGCGQGDCTVVLAQYATLVDAIDPASLDYGGPETIGQAQSRIKATDIGERIIFHETDPIGFLKSKEGADGIYDAIVLCHCLWYFQSKEKILETLKAAKGKAKRMCIAEWSLSSSLPKAQPHILGALTRATCEAHIADSDQNIRTPISPLSLIDMAISAGWRLSLEELLTPDEDLQDAGWEINMLLQNDSDGKNLLLKQARSQIKDVRVITLLESMLESVKVNVGAIGGTEEVRCMDVWAGVFM